MDEGFIAAMILTLKNVIEFPWGKRNVIDQDSMQILVRRVKRDNPIDQSANTLFKRNHFPLRFDIGEHSKHFIEMSFPNASAIARLFGKYLI